MNIAKHPIVSLGMVAVLAFVVRLPFIPRPFEPDEPCYALVAQEVLRGVPIYKGIADAKPPGLHFLYGVAMILFGFTAKGVHLFCALYNLLNVTAVWLLASALGGSVAGILSALFFALFSGAPRLLARANAEIFMVLPYVLSAYFFFRGLQNALPNRSFFLSGFFNILAILLKQVAYTNFLFFAVVLALCKDRPWKFRIKALTLISSGALAAAALIVAHFASERSLADFIHHAFLFGLRYSAGFDFNDALFRLFYMTGALLQEQSIVYLGAALFFLGHVPQEYRLQKKFVGLWMLTSFLGVSTGWAYLPHYFVQLLPALCVAAGLGFSIARLSAGLAFSVLACLLWFARVDYPFYFTYAPEESVKRQYEIYFSGPNSIVRPETTEIAQYIRQHSQPDDKLLVLGQSPEIYFLAQRRPATKYIVMTIYVQTDSTVYREVVDEFHERKPLYVVEDRSLQWMDYDGRPLTRTYRLEWSLPRFNVYRRVS